MSKDPIQTKPEYWRLRAEILALRDFLGITYAQSLGFTEVDSVERTQVIKDFKEAFESLVATHHHKILSEIEDISPRLASELDNREPGEIDTH